ncbi:MAG: mercury transporter [Oscillospiraceae bacterium]|nr:mercury transporter [Oscillospiraceae bacterium]
MQYVDDISNVVLILIRVGVVFRVIYCLLRLIAAEDEAAQFRRRFRNAIAFEVVAELIFVLKGLIIGYFS